MKQLLFQGLPNGSGLAMTDSRAGLDLATFICNMNWQLEWPEKRTEDCNVKDKGLRKKKTLFPSFSSIRFFIFFGLRFRTIYAVIQKVSNKSKEKNNCIEVIFFCFEYLPLRFCVVYI